MNKSIKNEELITNSNQPHSNELQEQITMIDNILMERLSDWVWDELKYFRKENPDCTDEMGDLIVDGEYFQKSPLINHFNKVFEQINNKQ